jgi:hypothetical protein
MGMDAGHLDACSGVNDGWMNPHGGIDAGRWEARGGLDAGPVDACGWHAARDILDAGSLHGCGRLDVGTVDAGGGPDAHDFCATWWDRLEQLQPHKVHEGVDIAQDSTDKGTSSLLNSELYDVEFVPEIELHHLSRTTHLRQRQHQHHGHRHHNLAGHPPQHSNLAAQCPSRYQHLKE